MAHGKELFLKAFAFVYLFAFTSLYPQINGLYGRTGLTPVYSFVSKYLGNNASTVLERVKEQPFLILFSGYLNLSPEATMEFITLTGILVSAFVIMFPSWRSAFFFAVLCVLYGSLHQVGQVFLWFQWDSLLLEAGFLAILLSPFAIFTLPSNVSREPKDGVMMFLLQWLLFRLMFASGIVKLTSGCPTWWSLTALNYHYESQCIPTSISWFAHHLPEWFQKLSVVSTYYIEGIVPYFFFLPLRSLKLFGCFCQVFFQLCIIATGNYNFFNILTIVLCFSLLDDSTPFFCSKSGYKNKKLGLLAEVLPFCVALTVVAASIYYTCIYFDVHFDKGAIMSQVKFSMEDFSIWVAHATKVAVLIATAAFIWNILVAFYIVLKVDGIVNQLWKMLSTIFWVAVAGTMFTVSIVPHSVVDAPMYHSSPEEVKSVYHRLTEASLCNSYGLFRRMTGVGGRPEVIIEGSNDLKEGWKEYDFLYKPGNLYRPLPFIAPHQPRLDWQMWFAALGSYQHNPWLIHLMYRLLVGQPEVLQLLDLPPFDKPPLYVRAKLYTYHYTDPGCYPSRCNSTSQWWTRDFEQEYVPALTWNEPTLTEFLSHHGYLSGESYKPPKNMLSDVLDAIRKASHLCDPHMLVWVVFLLVAVLSTVLQRVC